MKNLITLLILLSFVVTSAITVHAAQTPSGIPFTALETEIDAFVAQYLGVTTPGVAVVIVHEGEIIFSKGYGYADTTSGILVDPDTTIFEYGSIGKLFTWTAVMQLVERGLLDLDIDVANYLPADFMQQMAFEKPFTMRNLINHQAGFGEFLFDFVFDASTTDLISLREALILAQAPQIHTPGTVTAYSNFGSALAGYIIANISGQTFAAFEMENLLIPAGMANALNAHDWVNNHAFLENKAIGYTPNGRGGFNEIFWAYFPAYPAGSINGTAHDLARFAKALTPPIGESGPFFNDVNTLQQLFSPSALDHRNFPGTYHGFMRYISAIPAFGHGGDSIGFATNVIVVPEERFGIVVLTNTDGETDIRMGLPALLLGDNFDQIAPGAGNMPSAHEVEGTFLNSRSLNGQFLEFLDFLFLPRLEVTAINENEINITIGGMVDVGYLRFVQTEPFIYQMVYASSPSMQEMLSSQVRFQMIDGRPVQAHFGNIWDFIEISTIRSASNLTMSVVVAVVSILFFLAVPVVLLVGFIRSRKKVASSRFRLFRNCLILSGTLLVVNNISSFTRILVINLFRTTAEIAPHIWINYIGAGLAAIFCLGALVCIIKEDIALRSKILYFASATIASALIAVLVSWNFFIPL